MTSPAARFTCAAVVEPSFAAALVADYLVVAWHEGQFNRVPVDQRRAVAEVLGALRDAGEAWRNGERNVDLRERGSERNGAGGVGRATPESLTMSTSKAAEVLGVSRRRAQQLAAGGLGRLAGRRWVLDADLVQAELDRRQAS